MKSNLKTKRQALGFTLVEVMFSMLILTVLALGGGAALSHSGRIVAIQKNKRVAIEVANRHLERLRVSALLSAGHFETTALINGQTRRVFTDIVDKEGFKQVVVQVEYRTGGDWVSLATNMNK